MRVIIVSDFADINGGAPMVAVMSARGLAERGIPVTYVHGASASSEMLQHPNIRTIGLGLTEVWREPNAFKAAAHGIWNRGAARRLAALLGHFDPRDTIVHFHQWTKTLSPSTLGAVARAGFQHAITMHDYFLCCPNGAYFLYPSEVPCNCRPMSARCVATRCDARGQAHKFVRVARQLATSRAIFAAPPLLTILHVSTFSAEVAAPFLPAVVRQHVLRNPVDVHRAPPVEVRRNRPFVYVGRFTREKGCDLFAGAARKGGFEAVLMGGGPEETRLRRDNPAASLLPWGTRADVETLLRTARALVFPSRWYETHGLIVSEALAQGVPVIVSRATGARDFVEDGVNGLLVKPGSEADLLRCLARLGDGAEAERMGRNAHAMFWRDPPSLEAHVDALLGIYRDILPTAGGAQPQPAAGARVA